MHCTLPSPSAGSGGWSCSTPCVSQLQNPRRRDALPVGAIPRDSTHPSMHGKRAAQRGEAPRSPALTLGADTPLRGFLGKCRAWRIPHQAGGKAQPHREASVEAGEPASRRSHPRDCSGSSTTSPMSFHALGASSLYSSAMLCHLISFPFSIFCQKKMTLLSSGGNQRQLCWPPLEHVSC